MFRSLLTHWKWWERSQRVARSNAQQAAIVLEQQLRDWEDAERFVAEVTPPRRPRNTR